ncbi:MAG: hypothetical protein GW763_00375 [Paraglaciecola sp.]|nr:hypothetical protein [Paraglaciecola sp.]NCT46449.1 hypothetical protein [Paraglaciecola sp.]
MAKQRYLDDCQRYLREVYQLSLAGRPDAVKKHRAEGFMQAGIVLEIFTAEEIKHIIDALHLEVFGETKAQRQARNSEYEALKLSDPDKYFDEPAIIRKGQHTNIEGGDPKA